MKKTLITTALLLILILLIMAGCSNKHKNIQVLEQQQKLDIEHHWANETVEIRKDGHEVFDDADALGIVIEKNQDELTISCIARDDGGTGNIIFGMDSEDEKMVVLPENLVVQEFIVENKSATFELADASLKDVSIGSIISLWGKVEDLEIVADKLVVWSLRE